MLADAQISSLGYLWEDFLGLPFISRVVGGDGF